MEYATHVHLGIIRCLSLKIERFRRRLAHSTFKTLEHQEWLQSLMSNSLQERKAAADRSQLGLHNKVVGTFPRCLIRPHGVNDF